MIDGYGNGGFTIAGNRHEGSMLVFPDRSLPWDAGKTDDISLEALTHVFEFSKEIEILIIGCGPTFEAVPAGIREGLKAHGVVLEWMDTGAACRTYNVLLAEGRRVAAALIATD